MSNNDPNWSDDGFDSLNDGFLSGKPAQAEPVSSYHVPVPPPPTPPSTGKGSPRRAVLFLILFFITVVGLLITWVAKGPDSAGPAVVKQSTTPGSEEQRAEQNTELPVPQPAQTVETTETVETVDTVRRSRSDAASTVAKSRAPKPATDSTAAENRDVTVKPRAEKPLQPSTRSTASGLQEWCVQVFASTNADDADEWNDRLRIKNVYDSRIEIVDRQGQTWYRVRFGRFSTRQEAEESALSMGFRNAWVNRIR